MRHAIPLMIAAAVLTLVGAGLLWPRGTVVGSPGFSGGGVRASASVDAWLARAVPLDCAAPSRPVARVEDAVITAAELCGELHLLTDGVDDETVRGLQGPALLERLIDDRLVARALGARGLAVAPAEVEAEMDRLGAAGASPALLAAPGVKRGDLRREIARRLAREQLAAVGDAAGLLTALRREARIERLVTF